MRAASNCSRVIGGQPRSRPIRSIIVANGANESSAACSAVSAMKPCELMLSGGRLVARPRARRGGAARRSGAKRSGSPPMIASAIGSPSAPARTADCGRAADRDPDRQRLLQRPRVDAAVVERRAVRARPRDALLLAQREQQLELLGEQLVVVVEVVAEERERLDERAAPGHDLRAPAGEQVERREVLEDAHRVVGAEHGDGARQADALRALGRRGEHDRGRRDGEVRPVVLADAEDVEPDLVGELDLLDQVAQPLRGLTVRPVAGSGVSSAKV